MCNIPSSCRYWNYPLGLQMKLVAVFFLLILVPVNAAHVGTEENQIDRAATKDQESLPKTSIKCGECPCVNPCSQQVSPPPPPPPPSPPKISQNCAPPPPRFYYVSGPEDQTAQAQVTPPPPRFTYIIGSPPGSLYPNDPFNLEIYNGAIPYRSAALFGLLLPVICSFLQMLIFYGA